MYTGSLRHTGDSCWIPDRMGSMKQGNHWIDGIASVKTTTAGPRENDGRKASMMPLSTAQSSKNLAPKKEQQSRPKL